MLTTVNAKPRVFISFATPDLETVRVVAGAMKPLLTPRHWNEFSVPGQDAWETIHKEIDASDYVVAIITDATLQRAMAVGQEIGRAKAKGKHIIPLVSSNVKQTDLGCLCGVTYIRIDATQPAALAAKAVLLSRQILGTQVEGRYASALDYAWHRGWRRRRPVEPGRLTMPRPYCFSPMRLPRASFAGWGAFFDLNAARRSNA